ncbi:Nuclear hormone receptor family member nhr-125 [Caenorhabditis elegans]|uniref:Nuclear hormone receptor family member nhr-125 n=1 Tax=Caenorhabditis elegans TaxID=6239 RepID=A0A168H9N2_CAEEL|nr:Nuclear hormone receptor family member nhr-125 [Caenorhabditis elegans]SAP35594.1 Nuclear hormone receptor family member nhr-125 [Caenorhabditis elegans]|eukprot:NP_001317832.1 Nuclear hormone receptor family member nhr-125 [Caenorhabditis elegans]
MDLVSTSTSPFSCRICNQKAHGNHFGVLTCRACASFFRRAAFSKWSQLKCQKGGCSRNFCKRCRLKKCREMGMDTTKFQYNRDSFRATGQFQLPPPRSLASFVGRPELFLFCDTEAPNAKMLIDVRYLLEEAGRIINQGYETPASGKNQLENLTEGFKYIKVDMNNISSSKYASKDAIISMWEYYFFTVTRWLMYFEGFQKLNSHTQITLIQSVWNVWSRLHKYVATVDYHKANPDTLPTNVVIHNTLVDIENVEFDSTWLSDYPVEHVRRYLSVQHCREFDILGTLRKLNPSELEITYLFAQICFEHAGKRNQGDIMKVTEQFLDSLANDLHDYYVNEMNNSRYFLRLTQLLKINQAIQKGIWESRPKMELGRVFNVLKIEFSHPEMFEDSGYY